MFHTIFVCSLLSFVETGGPNQHPSLCMPLGPYKPFSTQSQWYYYNTCYAGSGYDSNRVRLLRLQTNSSEGKLLFHIIAYQLFIVYNAVLFVMGNMFLYCAVISYNSSEQPLKRWIGLVQITMLKKKHVHFELENNHCFR